MNREAQIIETISFYRGLILEACEQVCSARTESIKATWG